MCVRNRAVCVRNGAVCVRKEEEAEFYAHFFLFFLDLQLCLLLLILLPPLVINCARARAPAVYSCMKRDDQNPRVKVGDRKG